jgi:hypothetical protein
VLENVNNYGCTGFHPSLPARYFVDVWSAAVDALI